MAREIRFIKAFLVISSPLCFYYCSHAALTEIHPEHDSQLAMQHCPNHQLLPTHSTFIGADYFCEHADIHIRVDIPYNTHDQYTYLLIFELPAQPPFARHKSPLYASADFDRGDWNWGFTDTYIGDFSHALYTSAQLIDAVEQHNGDILCLYRSMLENYDIEGRLTVKKDKKVG